MSGTVTDVHAHLLGLDRDATGCILHERMRGKVSTRFILRMVGARRDEPAASTDARMLEHLFAALDGAPSVGRVVLLAFDGVYDGDGRLDEARTNLMVPNDHAFEVAARHPKLVVGCSVNPLRADAVAELRRAADRGAVLCKWIPASMGFDPADPRCDAFYDALVDLGMPLLSHTGTEMAVATVEASFGTLERLFRPLERGVRVIVPHAGGRKLFGDGADWRVLVAAMARFPDLWIDDSALALVHRRARLLRVLATPAIHDRVLHGSDYPLPVQTWAFLDRLGWRRMRTIASIPSPFERDVALKQALGVPDAFLTQADAALRRPTRP